MTTKTLNVRVTDAVVTGMCLALLFLLFSNISWASDDISKNEKKSLRHIGLGAGVGLVRFDTNFKFTEKSSGKRVFVDGEGTLGLPETDTIPIIYGGYRFNKRHGIGFAAFQIKREATLFQLDEEKDFHLGDITVTAGARANITLKDESAFYYLSYNYALIDDTRNVVFASLGIYALDLKYSLNAEGEITVQGDPVSQNRYTAEAEVLAPLPIFGIDTWSRLTGKWAMGTKVSLVGGTYEDISALILDVSVRAKYAFTDWFGLTFGITYFTGDITIDEPDIKTEVGYGYDGVALGLDFRF